MLIGLGVSVLLALRAAVRGTRLTPAGGDELPDGAGTVTYRFDGPLLLAAAHRFRCSLAHEGISAVDLRLSGLTAVDATGVPALRGRGIEVRIGGVELGHRRVLESCGVLTAAAPSANRGAIPSAAGSTVP
ncbi:hypothetical protein GCM10010121_039260 [Streptomyces brasiliensis]|uniref:STAS domain-containing protein n=1 Tax=Streptomyces brasiliensis TaxID=1954 RepID=A0A917KRQ0_9ACTN|nr:hypothetical protein GCM10010121_039260 [Streptomyces brasiliensis]